MPGDREKRRKREAYRKAQEDQPIAALPQKRLYRQRAHANPFSDHNLVYPKLPELMNWAELYPALASIDEDTTQSSTNSISRDVTVADIGCGFGGLLISLGPRLPEEVLLGMEIRAQVAEYTHDRINALRSQNIGTGLYQNIACVRANTMKFLPNFFIKHQLKKIFFVFPDPHFKARKHKARIVSTTLNSEYAYVLRPGGIVYTITDVEDLHNWMVDHFESHPSFVAVLPLELENDPCMDAMKMDTEEARKVERNKGPKFVACFRRLEDPTWPVA